MQGQVKFFESSCEGAQAGGWWVWRSNDSSGGQTHAGPWARWFSDKGEVTSLEQLAGAEACR
jgi:hypothetical protein